MQSYMVDRNVQETEVVKMLHIDQYIHTQSLISALTGSLTAY